MVEILKHVLVPKHEILSKEEKEQLLARYRIKERNLPKIKPNDPAAAAIGAKPGDVLRITRSSKTAGESVYYRLVLEA